MKARLIFLALGLFITTLLSAQDVNSNPAIMIVRDEWIHQPINNSEEIYTVGKDPHYDIQWNDPVILVFGTFDRFVGLDLSDEWLLENHGRRGNEDFLSNYFLADIVVDGRFYKSVEHYYQAIKFDLDSPIYNYALDAPTANDARNIATQYVAQAKLGDDDEMGQRMKRGLWAKFVDQNGKASLLGLRLLETGNQLLVEGNYRGPGRSDKRWGAEFDLSTMPDHAVLTGKNMLGKLLMEVRCYLQSTSLE